MVRPFFFAWHFLTAIPLSRSHHEPTSRELALSMRLYPLIGLMLGGLLATSDVLLSGLFSHSVVDALLIVLLVAVTGGLHQDGLADSLDGLAGGRTPAERLEIMRDGRIGAIGATGLVLVLGLRYAGLSAMPQVERVPLLLCMPAVGRWAMVLGAISGPYARTDGGLAEPFLTQLSWRDVLWATTLLITVLLFLVGPLGALLSMGIAALTARVLAAVSNRSLGGITGDMLGATNEIAEVVFLLASPVLLSWR
ncbi:MAG TPA: adenosylcobinamide-GDP ribazoletransferase [Nitrospiraceae bacterium]|nr:adenosylcobinamide-GDP ribazoletransferase [Nitrospiraceae bacterium]